MVGGGAAGLATAIFAARLDPSLAPLVLDGARALGAKILISGGGRCNVANAEVKAADFWQPASPFVRRVLRSFTAAETVAFFREIGVALHEEPGGKLFPDTNRARTVLDALLSEAGRRGVAIEAARRVTDLFRAGDGFRIETTRGPIDARRGVIATGGLSVPKSGSDGAGYAWAGQLGHSLVAPTPALAPLVLDGGFHAALQGASLPVEIEIHGAERRPRRIRGALLFTHFGVSGPAAMDASRFWHRGRLEGKTPRVAVSFLPGEAFEAVESFLLREAASRPRLAVATALARRVPASLADVLAGELRLDGVALGRLTREDRRRIVHALIAWPLVVRDSRGYNFAEATSGGVPLEEVNPASMQSRLCPGLHFVGEVLDVDGRIGGFNFQWAWSSAFVAARAIAGTDRTRSRPLAVTASRPEVP